MGRPSRVTSDKAQARATVGRRSCVPQDPLAGMTLTANAARALRARTSAKLYGKRSPGVGSYAAGSMTWLRASSVGSRDGAGSLQRAASQAAVTSSRTWRCCCFSVATTVIIVPTKQEPSGLWVPKLPLRQSTSGRMARSAALCVGSTPA
jgi:hypothetical protein